MIISVTIAAIAYWSISLKQQAKLSATLPVSLIIIYLYYIILLLMLYYLFLYFDK